MAGFAGAALFNRFRGSKRPLRPPGSIDEGRFSGVCVRCGNCGQVCPSRIIRHDAGGHGIASLLTPVVNFDNDYCREDCRRCNEVCPSGAIARLTLEQKRKRIIGLAGIDLDICLLAEGKECTACIRHCPYEAITIQTSDDGFSTVPRLDQSKCNGCGACEASCPTRPRRAVRVALLARA
jgi:ferredoxin-type protein NapF